MWGSNGTALTSLEKPVLVHSFFVTAAPRKTARLTVTAVQSSFGLFNGLFFMNEFWIFSLSGKCAFIYLDYILYTYKHLYIQNICSRNASPDTSSLNTKQEPLRPKTNENSNTTPFWGATPPPQAKLPSAIWYWYRKRNQQIFRYRS